MDASSPGPEEMIDSAIWSCPGDSRTAAQNAIRAGFDGVEMHGVDEYFVGRFSQDTVNQRTDSRGCSVDNRSRFALKVVKAVTNAIGSNKVGMRLISHTVRGLVELNISYLRLIESRVNNKVDCEQTEGIEFALDIWQDQGPVFVAGGYDGARARSAVDGEHQDRDTLIVFGRYFLSSPDLVYRLQHGIEPNEYDCSTF
ncbi:Chanoclavine-I aldehyde reductase fgaOx3 like protein [Verticillium longisporum]|uniref:Chanoclavine-I aldehyde reductase fgaOx3 like protein n=1 Tax=Verticillium longisporum TaxID=100787 RepID=A0A8I2ZX13_VERLO|nr:Chanoclavine-I aldehyde reductase fgaOx3 like protein [Verticillium longisporum]